MAHKLAEILRPLVERVAGESAVGRGELVGVEPDENNWPGKSVRDPQHPKRFDRRLVPPVLVLVDLDDNVARGAPQDNVGPVAHPHAGRVGEVGALEGEVDAPDRQPGADEGADD
jgi:hypothetical protein